jgi:hypothetical protein
MDYLQSDDHKYVINKKIDKQSLSNGRWQEMWGGPFFNLIPNVIWLTNSNQNLV